jgi:hypothetical protein
VIEVEPPQGEQLQQQDDLPDDLPEELMDGDEENSLIEEVEHEEVEDEEEEEEHVNHETQYIKTEVLGKNNN